MHAFTAAASARRTLVIAALATAVALAALVAALAGPPSAFAACENPRTPNDITNCYLPVSGSYSFTVPLSAATQSATGVAGDGSATGSASITMNASTNQVCATTTWSGVSSPVVWAHIHAGAYGQPEDPAVTIQLFAPDFLNGVPSGVSSCTTAAPGEIGAIVKCPAQFNVVVHSQKHAVGAIRGQMGTACSL
jgi:hypothetical protein